MIRILATVAAVLGLTFTTVLYAQVYPERTVTIVVPASPGGVTDFIGRLLSQQLTEKWGKRVIVDNRVGGGTLIGVNAVAKANPDGHTMLVMPLGSLFSSIVSKATPINFEKDLVPVAVVGSAVQVLVANSNLPVTNITELIAYAKQRPDELSYGTVGAGSLPDVAVALLKSMSATKMVAIPYGGNTPAMTDLLTGRIHLLFLPLGSALPHINTGKIRAIGVSDPQRVSDAPEIPSISEGLPGYSVVSWQALMITGGTPEAIIDKINQDVHEITARPEVLEQFKKLHLARSKPVRPDVDKGFILSEFRKWKSFFNEIGLGR
jgi:tripartite-type tricarboxylate transporter receptor subunit TctC